jgi:glycosyltransferase involved in cell wall biosynthesis
MKLAIVNLTGGGLSRGYRKYLQRLLALFDINPRLSRLDVFVPPGSEDLLGLESIPLLSWPVKDYRLGFQWLKARIRELSPDAVFIPTAQWLGCDKTPVVVMLRNMEPLTLPFGVNPLREKIRNLFRAHVAKRACHKADRVIAISQHVQDFLCKQWKLDLQKIGLVFHGVDLPSKTEALPAPSVLRHHGSKPFIFAAGSIRPARGLEDVLRALGGLKKRGIEFTLAIAGEIDPGMKDYKYKLERLSSNLNIMSQVIWTGPLTFQEMSWCYHNCTVFVMTSRAEACPNIALEAIAHGCVCISTDTPPMPEFFRDTAVYYPPRNWRVLADVIQTVLAWDNNRLLAVSQSALERAAKFSWDVCAEKTLDELAKVART